MTREEELKLRLATVLQDLRDGAVQDPEAMALVGSLASDLADKLEQQNWTGSKQVMTSAAYDALLESFQKRGNDHYKSGRTKHAYAIQVLGLSLVSATQRQDGEIAAGEKLLDEVIDRATARYRQSRVQKLTPPSGRALPAPAAQFKVGPGKPMSPGTYGTPNASTDFARHLCRYVRPDHR